MMLLHQPEAVVGKCDSGGPLIWSCMYPHYSLLPLLALGLFLLSAILAAL